jgi:hypothetical protein
LQWKSNGFPYFKIEFAALRISSIKTANIISRAGLFDEVFFNRYGWACILQCHILENALSIG